MTRTTRIYGPGLPDGGHVLLMADLSPNKLEQLLTDTTHVVPLVGGRAVAYHGGRGCPFSFIQSEDPELELGEAPVMQVPTRVR